MGRLATHYADRPAPPFVLALCGKLPTPKHATREREAVTCKVCRKRLEAVPFAPAELVEEAPFEPRELEPSTVPELTPLERALAAGHTVRTRHRHRWASVEQALAFVAATRADGYPAGSASQSIERIGEQGVIVQSSGRAINRGTAAAEEVAEVMIALVAALERARLPDGFDVWLAWPIYRDRRIGVPIVVAEFEGRKRAPRVHMKADDARTVARRYGVRPGEVGAVCLEVRRSMHIELQARGLMRPTKTHADAVERRRDEMRKGKRW